MNEYTFKNKNIDKKFFYTQDNHLKDTKEQLLIIEQDKSSPSPIIKNLSKIHPIPEENNDKKEFAINMMHKNNNINSNVNTNNDNNVNLNLFQSKPIIKKKKKKKKKKTFTFIKIRFNNR